MKRATTGFGLRQRLLLSFIAISGFAVVAAVVGNYAFYATGEALHQVTEKSVPPAIATLEFAQRTERIVAAGPALLGVTSSKEFDAVSSVLEQELKEARRLLSELPGQGLTAEKLGEILNVFDRVSANLETLKSAVQTENRRRGSQSGIGSRHFRRLQQVPLHLDSEIRRIEGAHPDPATRARCGTQHSRGSAGGHRSPQRGVPRSRAARAEFSRRPPTRSRRWSAPPVPARSSSSRPFALEPKGQYGASTVWCPASIRTSRSR